MVPAVIQGWHCIYDSEETLLVQKVDGCLGNTDLNFMMTFEHLE